MSKGLAALLGAMSSDFDDEDEKPTLPPTEVIGKLQQVAAKYIEPVPYQVGSLVTPRSRSNMKGHGEPHLVIDTITDPKPVWTKEAGSFANGKKFNIRVLCMMRDDIVAFWGEAGDYDLYIPPKDRIPA